MSIFDLADKLFDGIEPLPFVEFVPVPDAKLVERWLSVLDHVPAPSRSRFVGIQPTRLSKEGDHRVLTFNLCGMDGDTVMQYFRDSEKIWNFLADEFGPVMIKLDQF